MKNKTRNWFLIMMLLVYPSFLAISKVMAVGPDQDLPGTAINADITAAVNSTTGETSYVDPTNSMHSDTGDMQVSVPPEDNATQGMVAPDTSPYDSQWAYPR